MKNDTFDSLAADLMNAYTATVVALHRLSEVKDASGDDLRSRLAVMANAAATVGVRFALRGATLANELPSASVEVAAQLAE